MLDSLRFVQGAVARKDFVNALTHFEIKGGFVKGFNGAMTLCAPIDLDLEVTPKASTFTRAILTCKDAISITQTNAGRLSIKSGKFRALVDCTDEYFPVTIPEGDEIAFPTGGVLKVLKALEPFIAKDASRPWACGILLMDHSAYATNNSVLIEHWLGYKFPIPLNIPKDAIAEMLRIGEEPSRMQCTENSVTFFYSNNRWLKTQLYSIKWPDLGKVLNEPTTQLVPVTEGLWEALESLYPFVDKLRRIYVRDGWLSTDRNDDNGALVELPGLVGSGIYNVDFLLELKGIAEQIDFFWRDGKGIYFFGDHVRGAMMGQRDI
jgi:hypothetical protein